jgi:hypothetical protein
MTMNKTFPFLLAVVLLAAGCTPSGPSAAGLMPTLDAYNMITGESLTNAISKLGDGAALLAGHPELALLIEAVDGVMGCYQEVEAVSARLYSAKDDPLGAGVIAIVDRNRMLDPNTFTKCVLGQESDGMRAMSADIQICANTYVHRQDNNEYYILYAATKAQVCADFCGALAGCAQ